MNASQARTSGVRAAMTGMTEILLILTGCIFLILLARFRWKRRRLCQMASLIDGPKYYPFMGSAHLFYGTTEEILKTVMEILTKFKPLAKVWLGHRLFFVTCDPKHFDIIFNHPKGLTKDELYKFLKPFVGNGLFDAPADIWKQNRKIIQPTFNQKILNDFVHDFYEQSVILTDILQKKTNQVISIKHFITKFTLDTVGKTSMGVELHEQISDSEVAKWLDRASRIVFQRMFQIWYHPDFIFYNSPIGRECRKLQIKFMNYMDKVIQDKKSEFRKQKDWAKQHPEAPTDEDSKMKTFLQLLLELNEERKVLSDIQLRDEVNTFLIAGYDTTAIMMSFICLMLGMFPEFQERVYEEVLDVVGPDRPIVHEDLPNLKYLERFILETMRLFPVGPLVVRAHEGDIDLGDAILPKGASTVMVILGTHRSEKYWPDPLKFDPDRFLPEEVSKRHPYAYVPFTAGPRNCIGKRYAMMLMKVSLAHLVRKFKLFTLSYKKIEDVRLRQDFLIAPVLGYDMRLESRD